MSWSPCRQIVPLAVVALGAGLVACGPALDWREMQPGAAGLRATFPCRPDRQVRSVPLAGTPVVLTLHVCQASDLTFAVSYADVADPARVGPVLIALHEAMERNLGVAPAASAAASGQAGSAWQVSGMTPQPASGRWTLQGRLPDGRAVRAETAVFSRGTQVVQATLLGTAGAEAAARPFFEGLRFVP